MAARESTSTTTSSPPRRSDRGTAAARNGGSPFVAVLRFAPVSLQHYRRSLRLRGDRSALTALARAIASTPGWPEGTRFAVRADPAPVLGILDESHTLRPADLQGQARACEAGVGRLRYLGYREIERDVGLLAARLAERFGAETLRSFSYTAIPRGGLVVLGLLAARLGIPAGRVVPARPPTEQPLVVVDDCALSGGRFGAFLAECPAPRVIFAHLYSHRELRSAICSREARILDCVAARDLSDEGPERLGDHWAEARERWTGRLAGNRYWLGDCERIAFPWNEPERLVWNPESQEVELGWKLVPPELCFKRPAGREAETRRVIQVQPRGAGPWRPASAVLFAWRRGATFVHRLDTGECLQLPGTAHDMWWALLRGGEPGPALRILSNRYQIAEEALASDLSAFLETLETRGLFEKERLRPARRSS